MATLTLDDVNALCATAYALNGKEAVQAVLRRADIYMMLSATPLKPSCGNPMNAMGWVLHEGFIATCHALGCLSCTPKIWRMSVLFWHDGSLRIHLPLWPR